MSHPYRLLFAHEFVCQVCLGSFGQFLVVADGAEKSLSPRGFPNQIARNAEQVERNRATITAILVRSANQCEESLLGDLFRDMPDTADLERKPIYLRLILAIESDKPPFLACNHQLQQLGIIFKICVVKFHCRPAPGVCDIRYFPVPPKGFQNCIGKILVTHEAWTPGCEMPLPFQMKPVPSQPQLSFVISTDCSRPACPMLAESPTANKWNSEGAL